MRKLKLVRKTCYILTSLPPSLQSVREPAERDVLR